MQMYLSIVAAGVGEEVGLPVGALLGEEVVGASVGTDVGAVDGGDVG